MKTTLGQQNPPRWQASPWFAERRRAGKPNKSPKGETASEPWSLAWHLRRFLDIRGQGKYSSCGLENRSVRIEGSHRIVDRTGKPRQQCLVLRSYMTISAVLPSQSSLFRSRG